MKKIPFATILVALLLVLVLASCTQAASTPLPEVLPQAETIFPVATQLGATIPVIDFSSLTETTVAFPIVEATPTPEAPMENPEVTSAPEIGAEQPTEAETVIVPTATSEGLQGGCSANIQPYQGLGAGSPTFGVCGVIKDASVTVQTNDYIAGQTYNVYMGSYSSGGAGGILIGSYNTNNGGRYSEIYPIPDNLKGMDRIAIRIEFSSGWYATNWFYNISTD